MKNTPIIIAIICGLLCVNIQAPVEDDYYPFRDIIENYYLHYYDILTLYLK